jgi:hypothetical protein
VGTAVFDDEEVVSCPAHPTSVVKAARTKKGVWTKRMVPVLATMSFGVKSFVWIDAAMAHTWRPHWRTLRPKQVRKGASDISVWRLVMPK